MARPSKLTPELRERIEQELADAAPIVVVAQRTGVSPRSLSRWLSQGLVARPSAADASLGFAVPTLVWGAKIAVLRASPGFDEAQTGFFGTPQGSTRSG